MMWLAIAILLWAVVFAPAPGETRWIRTLHNSAHAPIFGCVAFLALILIRTRPRLGTLGLPSQYGLALAVAVVLGVMTEFVQLLTGRDASFEDALHDTIGAVAALGIFAVFDTRLRVIARAPVVRFMSGVVGLVCLSVAATPVTRAALKYQQRDQRFPVLADFTQRFDRYFILQQSAEISPSPMPPAWASFANEQAMHVRLLDGPYPGLHFIEVPPDWSRYPTLAIDLTNPTSLTLQFVVRVHDTAHNNQVEDRFNRVFELPPRTRQVIRIPLRDVAAGPRDRKLDLRHVAGMIVFRIDESPRVSELYFSRAWLE